MNGQAGLLASVGSRSGLIKVQVPFQGNHLTSELGMKRPSSVMELCRNIGEFYGIKAKPMTARQVGETPKDVSKMTQEQMAVAIARDMSGKKRLGPIDRLEIGTALYNSIHNLVYQLANQFSTTCKDSVDDLAQDCMYRIITQLWRYTPSRGKFTTWTWYVCRGVLDKKYEKTNRLRGIVVDEGHLTNDEGDSMFENMPDRPIEGVQHNECQGVMAAEMVDTIRDIAKKHPGHKKLLFEIFGNPDDENFIFPTEVSLIDAAKAAGIEYSRARTFYSTVVRRFFKRKFAG